MCNRWKTNWSTLSLQSLRKRYSPVAAADPSTTDGIIIAIHIDIIAIFISIFIYILAIFIDIVVIFIDIIVIFIDVIAIHIDITSLPSTLRASLTLSLASP